MLLKRIRGVDSGLKHPEGRIRKDDVIIKASVSQSRVVFSFSIGVSPVAASGIAGPRTACILLKYYTEYSICLIICVVSLYQRI